MIEEYVNRGSPGTIEVSAAGYSSLSEKKVIDPNLNTQAITITIFPSK